MLGLVWTRIGFAEGRLHLDRAGCDRWQRPRSPAMIGRTAETGGPKPPPMASPRSSTKAMASMPPACTPPNWAPGSRSDRTLIAFGGNGPLHASQHCRQEPISATSSCRRSPRRRLRRRLSGRRRLSYDDHSQPLHAIWSDFAGAAVEPYHQGRYGDGRPAPSFKPGRYPGGRAWPIRRAAYHALSTARATRMRDRPSPRAR